MEEDIRLIDEEVKALKKAKSGANREAVLEGGVRHDQIEPQLHRILDQDMHDEEGAVHLPNARLMPFVANMVS